MRRSLRLASLLCGVASLASTANVVSSAQPAAALSPVVGAFEAVVGSTSDSSNNLLVEVRGWAITADFPTAALATRITVDGAVWLPPRIGYFYADKPRPDIGAFIGTKYGNNHGIDEWVHVPHGTHTLCLQSQNSGVYTTLGCKLISYNGLSKVVGAVSSVTPDPATQTVNLKGYALTSDFPTTAITLRMSVDGFAVSGTILANAPDAGIGNLFFGFGNNHGFNATFTSTKLPAGGPHRLCVDGQNSGVYNLLNCLTYYLAPTRAGQLADLNSLEFDTSYGNWKPLPCTATASVCDKPATATAPGTAFWPYMDWTNDHCSAVGDGPFDFSIACARHDFGNRNLARISAQFPGSPTLYTANNLYALNRRFLDDMLSRCNEWTILVREPCVQTAQAYFEGVNAWALWKTGVGQPQQWPIRFS